MSLSSLNAISPIDGRYQRATAELATYFSEAALIKYRVYVEVEYFIALSASGIHSLEPVNEELADSLRSIYVNFTDHDAQQVKDLEQTTNHDVKAVEYFIKQKFDELGLSTQKEFIHFGLTSQDINNTAIPYLWKEALHKVYYPNLDQLKSEIESMAENWKSVPMLAKTHGQPASPTRLGKELDVYIERLGVQLEQLKCVPFSAKFGGATGNFNAHHVAYPSIDWKAFGNYFVNEQLALNRSQFTTQIEHYDNFAAQCDALKRINNILIDLCRDIWTYISMDYFKQQIVAGQIGSSAMPHKVNPIDFENAEGNFGMANAIFEHLAAKLPISRLQRDLTDSTVLRNIGVPIAHTLIAVKSTLRGLRKLILNEEAMQADLAKNWAVVAEAIQTILRREGYPKPYETLKELTRVNTGVNETTIAAFVDQLDIADDIKAEIKKITPWNYTGI